MDRTKRLIGEASKKVRQRPLTQVIPLASARDAPPGYFRIAVQSVSVFSKVQVLSNRELRPVFVETGQHCPIGQRCPNGTLAYWAHRSILPDLVSWLDQRAFTLSELLDSPERPAHHVN